MIVGTMFTLFVVPVFYSLIAAQHRPETAEAESGESFQGDESMSHPAVPAIA